MAACPAGKRRPGARAVPRRGAGGRFPSAPPAKHASRDRSGRVPIACPAPAASVQVECAGAAVPDPGDRLRVVRGDPLTELAREQMAAGDRQAPLRRRLGGRQVEHVLLDAGEIEPPGNRARAPRRSANAATIAVGPPTVRW